jgi:hypothetical protein
MSDSDLDRRLERLDRVLGDGRHASRVDRAIRRAERAERKRGHQGKPGSYVSAGVMLTVALICAGVGIFDPHRFWLIWVALGLGLSGGRQLEQAIRASKSALPSGSVIPDKAPVVLPARDRADLLCDQLLAELKDSPQAVRDFLGKPEATVEAIRAACQRLKDRQTLMLSAVSTEQAEALEAEKRQLEARLGHLDESTYKRATDALKQRQELFHQVRSSAEKLESERQIFLNTLESLRMRVVLAKGAGATGGSLDDMKREVSRLSDELSAITDALETEQKGELQAIAPIEAEGEPGAAHSVQPERSRGPSR